MNTRVRAELSTISSTLDDVAARLSALVTETERDDSGDLYGELVAAERTVNALQRRLSRTTSRLA